MLLHLLCWEGKILLIDSIQIDSIRLWTVLWNADYNHKALFYWNFLLTKALNVFIICRWTWKILKRNLFEISEVYSWHLINFHNFVVWLPDTKIWFFLLLVLKIFKCLVLSRVHYRLKRPVNWKENVKCAQNELNFALKLWV